MLRIIYGEAGTGKSEVFYNEIIKSAESGKKTLLFVPDQFSFEAEKLIYKKVPRKFSRYVRVTTPARESQRILHLFGKTKEYADDITKNILMMCAVRQAVSDGMINYYSKQVSSVKFPAFMIKIISEIKNAGLTPSRLKNIILDGDFSPSLEKKLNDISVIYSAYEQQFTDNRFSDRLDDILTASELILEGAITENHSYDGSDCYFDGFDTFSGSQFSFIKALMSKSDTVTFSLMTENPDSSKREFLSTTKLIGRLKYASEDNYELIKDTTVYKKCDRLRIIQAADPWNESDWICSEIKRLTDGEERCRDIAILIPDTSYAQILTSAMKKYSIPAFIDIPEPLISKSFVRFAIYTLRALSFETEDLLRYIKSGFVRIPDKTGSGNSRTLSDYDTDSLERLCREHDLRKRDWLSPFPDGLKSHDYYETLRADIINPLITLKKELGSDDGGEMIKVLCDFLCNKMCIQRTIQGMYIKYDNETPVGENEKKKRIIDNKKMELFTSVWDDVVTVFESAYKSLSGKRISFSEFMDMLISVFTSTTVSKPPQTLDAVTVGDTQRSRFTRKKTVFMCGFNHGVMPPRAKVSEAFSGSENEELSSFGIPITPDRESRFSEEQFLIYRCINIPEDKLYITYPITDAGNKPTEPAPEIEGIKKRFGNDIITEYARNFGAEFYCRTEKASLKYLAGIYSDRSHSDEKTALLNKLSEHAEELLYASGEKGNTERHLLKASNAENLMKKEAYSPSRIEKMNRCKFSYFCRYGLDLKEENERDVNSVVIGNAVHYCLQKILQEENFTDFSDDDISRKIALYVGDFEEENYIESFGSSKRFSYNIRSIAETAVKASCRIRDDIREGSFMPAALEEKITFTFGDVIVEGNCDRYDIAEIDGKKYVRVIDYKHSEKKIRLSNVYNGQNLQMLLYLFGLCDRGMIPSSVTYLPYGKLTPDKTNSAAADKKALKSSSAYIGKNKMSGIILDNSPEITPENEKFEPIKLTPDAFESMKEYCRSYVSTKISEVLSGMIGACAYDDDVCKNCRKYSGYDIFCGRDEILADNSEEE